ncbi:AAA family ATPase [Rhizobium leguminosarum bv. viciae]|nr:AAA family ATPase [Rhizobium leguminosarum bv. viciae]
MGERSEVFKRIANVRDFGVFNNFAGTGIPEFGAFNIIYGWNYSGKTTLSRLFRCLEVSSLHPDYPDAKFNLSHGDGVGRDHEFGTPTTVRVFNEDFRKEHLLWDDSSGFNPILLLGSENIEKQAALKSKFAELNDIKEVRKTAAAECTRLLEKVKNAETECASQLVRELPVGRIDRRHINQISDSWKGVLPEPLDDESYKDERLKVGADQKEELPLLKVDLKPHGEQWKRAVALLDEQVGSSATLSRLAESSEIGNWVQTGLHIHREATRCEFCEGSLSPERVASLNAHFSSAFTELKSRILKASEWVSDRTIKIDGNLYGRAFFYADLHREHGEAGAALAKARDVFNSALDELLDLLLQKGDNPFQVVTAPSEVPSLTDLSDAAARFQTLIDANNRRTREFRSERDAAVSRLKVHYVTVAMRKIDLFNLNRKIEELKTADRSVEEKITALEAQIIALQAELSESTKGAEAINEALRRSFGKEDIQVRVVDDKFVLMRANRPAKNLSEGERTAIAFCYFITKLLENGNELADTIVYIDDPISSLDSHHLLHVNAFLKDTFLKHDSGATPQYSCLAKQVFVSTHNYEFFHLTWEWMTRGKSRGFSSAFMVERSDANGLISSKLIECPKSILKFRSEYLFLYHQLAAYVATPSNDLMVIFNLGNMARRFMEGYLAFKFMESEGVDKKLPLIITDTVHCERARKFMHFYSHTHSRGGGMKLPDMAEALAAISSILDGVRNHDPVHYRALQAAT